MILTNDLTHAKVERAYSIKQTNIGQQAHMVLLKRSKLQLQRFRGKTMQQTMQQRQVNIQALRRSDCKALLLAQMHSAAYLHRAEWL